MSHIDEGTIHAWLDGELDAARGSAIEAHIATCRQCADAVAEARGLVAASSRILASLDQVPGNVIPKSTVPTPVAKPSRIWRAAPWVTGIAAVLMAAVVLRVGDKGREGASVASSPSMTLADTFGAADAVATAQPPSAPTIARGSQEQGGPPPATSRAAVGAAARRSGIAAVSGAVGTSVAKAPMVDSARERRLESTLADAAVTSAPAAEGRVAGRMAVAAPERSVSELRVAPAPPASAPAHGGLVGCYAIAIPVRAAAKAADFAAANQSQRRAAQAAAAPSVRAESEVANTMVVRLDSVAGRPGFMVRLARTDSSIGWWTRLAADSARVDLLAAGVTFATPAQRITCPQDR